MKKSLFFAVGSLSLLMNAAQAEISITTYQGQTAQGRECSMNVIKCERVKSLS